jgi:hypothetical protein
MAVWFMRWLQGVLCEQYPLFDICIAGFAAGMRAPSINSRDDAIRGKRARFHLPNGNQPEGTPGRRQIGRVPCLHEGRNAWL